jgi:hypothetical protein
VSKKPAAIDHAADLRHLALCCFQAHWEPRGDFKAKENAEREDALARVENRLGIAAAQILRREIERR